MTLRIDTLTYHVVWQTTPPSILPSGQHVTLGDFECVIEATVLTATPVVDFSSQAQAGATLDPYLRAWEIELELERGYRVHFRLSGSHAVDAPSEAGRPTNHIVGIHETLTMSGSLHVTAHTDLSPPTSTYLPTPLVHHQYLTRLRDLLEGREKAPAAAYAILTDLDHTFGNGDRPIAAKALHISSGLLTRVSRLASAHHPTEGRKVARGGDALTDADLDWLRRAVPVLVRRAAAVGVWRDEPA